MADAKPSAREQFLLALSYSEKVAALRADADRALAQKAVSAEDYQTLRNQYAPHERRAQKALERLRASARRSAERATQEAAATRARQAALEASPGATAADAARINEEHRRLAAEAAKLEAHAVVFERLARAERASTLGQPPHLPLDVFAAQVDAFTQPRDTPSAATTVAISRGGGAPSTDAEVALAEGAASAPIALEPIAPVSDADFATTDDTTRDVGLRRFAPTLVFVAIVAGLALAGLFLLTLGSPRIARADITFTPAASGGGAIVLTCRNRGSGPLQLHVPWPEERATLIDTDDDMAHIGVDVYLRDDDAGEFRLLPTFAEAWTAAGTSSDMIIEANLEATITFHPDRLSEGGFAGDAVRLVVTDVDGDEIESYTTNLINREV